MSWIDDLQKVKLPDGRRLIGASFRGVAFFVATSELAGGRRAVVHEFPGRDDPSTDDLGRRARRFSVEGYVLGDDYIEHRDNLLSALEDDEGPGLLIHPYLGNRSVICDSYAVREAIIDGGVATFQLSFVEAPGVSTIVFDAGFGLDALIALARAANDAEVNDLYDVTGAPGYATLSLSRDLAAISSAMDTALSPLTSSTQALAKLNADLNLLTAQASSIIRAPSDAVSGLLNAITALTDTVTGIPGKLAAALLDAYGTPVQPLAIGTTTTRVRERANQDALGQAMRRTLAIEAARLLPEATFDSFEEATAARDRAADILEELAEQAGTTAYPALVNLRSGLLRAIPGDAELARERELELRTELPSLVLAYRLYGDVDQEADLIARNRVQHPGFISGALKVLNHDG